MRAKLFEGEDKLSLDIVPPPDYQAFPWRYPPDLFALERIGFGPPCAPLVPLVLPSVGSGVLFLAARLRACSV